MNSLPQMSLVTRNFSFSNALPTSLQRLNVSKVLDHSHQLRNSTLESTVIKEPYLHKQQEQCPLQLCNAQGQPLSTKTCIFTCLHICIFIYESVAPPYSKNDLRRLIRIETIEQNSITEREHKFKEKENKRKNESKAIEMIQEWSYYKNAFLQFCTFGSEFSSSQHCWDLRGLINQILPQKVQNN